MGNLCAGHEELTLDEKKRRMRRKTVASTKEGNYY